MLLQEIIWENGTLTYGKTNGQYIENAVERCEMHKHKLLRKEVMLSFCQENTLMIKVDIDRYKKELTYLDILQQRM